MDDQNRSASELLALTADIVAAFVQNNQIDADRLPSLISSVHQSLSTIGQPVTAEELTVDEKKTRAEIRKSMTDDALISFVDDRPYKSLKRHLSTNGMTPDQYRERFGLPADYPMVARSYSAARSALAKAAGLGVGGRKPKADAAPAKRGRPAKASA